MSIIYPAPKKRIGLSHLSRKAIKVKEYDGNKFDNLYFDNDQFYVRNNNQYFVSDQFCDVKDASYFVLVDDVNKENQRIYINKFKDYLLFKRK